MASSQMRRGSSGSVASLARLVAFVLFLMALIFGLCYVCWSVWREEPLNVVLITLDTTRADHLKTYGYENGLTDQFDRFARSGVVFERAYAPAPITLPSHTSMLTGLYPPEHGLRLNGLGKLPQDVPLLPDILKRHGYDTAAFISAPVLDSTFGLNRGFDVYDDFATNRKLQRFRRQRRPGQHVVDSALAWLRSRKSAPFFCWVHLFDAHGPYDSRDDLFGNRFQSSPYDAGIATELREVERIIALINQQQLDRNTLVIVTADHGEGLGEHREAEHGMLAYNSTLRVPLIFSGTKYCQSHLRVSTTVSLVDIAPTVLDILRIRGSERFSGRSLKAALTGSEIPAAVCYAEAETPYILNRWCPLYAIISDRWKFIQTTQPELYDLSDDPGENRNRYEVAMEQAREMENQLESIQQSFRPAELQNVRLTDKQLSDLSDLGYVGVRDKDMDLANIDRTQLKDIKDVLPELEMFDEAKRLSLNGNVTAAITLLREIERKIDPGEFLEAGYLLGDCLVVAGHPDEAVDVYQRILDKHPDIGHTHFRLAMALTKQGNLEQAIEEFRKSLQYEPGSFTGHCELARLLVRSGKLLEAVAEYYEAIKITPDVSPVHVELGELFLRLNRSRDAMLSFESALKINPHDSVAQVKLLTLLVQSGDQTRAVERAMKSVRSDPQSFEAHFNLGVLLVSLNQHREALEAFREARKLRPDEPRVLQQIRQLENTMQRSGN